MITIDEILAMRKNRKAKPTHEELRKLPCKKAFVYGRVSSLGQVRDSKESIREIAKVVGLAKSDSYQSNITAEETERWLLSIQSVSVTEKVMEDGDILVDVQDLGISARGLTDEKRHGLAHLKTLIGSGEVGAVYVTEGVSRLSRDQERILPFQLLRLFKEQQCRLRTPDGVWNPAIEKDWEALADEFEDAIGELKIFRRRMYRRKKEKAARGEYVGEPVPPGFYLPIVGQKRDGRYEFGKSKPYPPHSEVCRRILQEFVKQQGSELKTTQALHGVVFPFFPKELAYMESRSALKVCLKAASGYCITPSLVKGVATNLKMIGIWEWGDNFIEDNHEPAVSKELFLTAHELAIDSRKPRGRSIYFEPLEWDGLLWCCNHVEPRPLCNHRRDRDYSCQRDYHQGKGHVCLSICHRFLDEPLATEVLRQLDFGPYADEVLVELEAEVIEGKVEIAERKRQIADLERRLENLQSYFGCGDPQREEIYWEQYKKTQDKLNELKAQPLPLRQVAVADIQQVREFLSKLPYKWATYPATLRNRLLKFLIERVELHHDRETIEARIIWKANFEQILVIYRPVEKARRENRWTDDEDKLLRMLWPSSSQRILLAAFPNRSWESVAGRAFRLHLRRERCYHPPVNWRRWTVEEDSKLATSYESGVPLETIATDLSRSKNAIENRAAVKRLVRPAAARWKTGKARWLRHNLEPLHPASLGR